MNLERANSGDMGILIVMLFHITIHQQCKFIHQCKLQIPGFENPVYHAHTGLVTR